MTIEALLPRPGEEGTKFTVTGESLPPGLNQFFLDMSDPSVEHLEETAVNLAKLPYDDLRFVQERLLNATYESALKRSLVTHGVSPDEAEKLETGAYNTERLVDRLCDKFDTFTDPPSPYRDIDTRDLAEELHHWIQVQKAEGELRRGIKSIQNEPDLRKRNRLALNLRREIFAFVDRFNVTFTRKHGDKEEVDPTWKKLTEYFGWSAEINYRESSTSSYTLEDAITTAYAASRRLSLEKRIDKLPQIYKEDLEQLCLQYGAKAANLIVLANMAAAITGVRDRWFRPELVVPEFRAVPVDLYEAWKEGRDIDGELLPYFDWAITLKAEDDWGDKSEANSDYIVRSSAVFSEDGEQITGAGIYESVRVPAGSSFEKFKAAVAKVYESTDSERAQSYRQQHGVAKEQMGIVIQKWATPARHLSLTDKSDIGYVNTKLPGVPDLMEIATETSRNFVRREVLDFYLALEESSHEATLRAIHHFPLDQFKVDEHMIARVGQLALTVEKVWGREVQIEFVASGHTINFVQIREIPKSQSIATEIQFPDKQEIHSGASIGVGDVELELLHRQNYNRDKIGVVVIPSNDMWTTRGSLDNLPESGAVIITDPEGHNGHIQSLCAESGLICIYPSFGQYDRPTLRHHELLDLKRMRVVSNGLEGRVYQIEENQ